MSLEEKIEKRLHPRLKRNLPIEILDSVSCKVLETRDISASGVYCKVDKDIPIMTKLGITLMLSFFENEKKIEKKVECNGIVVRSAPDATATENYYEIAILFDSISEKNRELLVKFIEKSLN